MFLYDCVTKIMTDIVLCNTKYYKITYINKYGLKNEIL